ncbi:hypothetical protein RB595_006013 [Gaeumannomyces hyphopodioides]
MRLLNTRTLQLEEFGGGSDGGVPPYSILSHRWGREEVDFQGMRSERRRHLQGFQKLARFCALSLEEGYGYGWMDTCCIDKSSSAELSEAINSMFRWYQDASICYAYLGDVATPPGTDPTSSDSSFRHSQWFKRGWTLQELIAPDSVVFLNSEWQEIGTRTTLGPLLHSITGIHDELFKPSIRRGRGLSALLRRYSIAQKLSWASRRTTTRIEDEAYCLMGLLDVNMPLLYGEGKKAFMRLQQLVMDQSDDASIFVWHSPTVTGTTDAPSRKRLVTGLLADSPLCFIDAQNVESIHTSRFPAEGPTSLHCYEVSKTAVIMRVPILEGDQVGPTPGSDSNGNNLGMLQPLNENVLFAVLDCRDAKTGQRIVLPLLNLALGGSRVFYRYQVGKTLYYSGEASSPPARTSLAAYLGADSRFLEYSRGTIRDLVPRSSNLVTVRIRIPPGGYRVLRVGGKRWMWTKNDEMAGSSAAPVELWGAGFGMKDSAPGWMVFDCRGAALSDQSRHPFAFACHPQPGGHMRFTLRTLEGQSGELDDVAAGWDMYHSAENSEKRLRLPGGRMAVVKARVGAATCGFLISVRS